jgi:RHS repeat-associated protein
MVTSITPIIQQYTPRAHSRVGDRSAYTPTNQLSAIDYANIPDQSFTYDLNGNRTGSGNVTGADNRLTSNATWDFVYDANGNMTRRTLKSDNSYIEYTYDHRDRLTDVRYRTSAGTLTKRVHFGYDALNRRYLQTVENGSGTILSTVYYVNQGFRKDRGDAGDEIALRLDGTGAVISRYLHGSMVDEVLAEENIGSGGVRDVLWAMTDHQGSVRDLARVTSGTASVVNHIVYDAFGKTVSETDTAIAHLYGYTGRELDKETGLQYNRARYLDLVLARWISQDPIGFAAGDTNLYRYVGNHPNMATDPSGLWEEPEKDAEGRYISGGGWDFEGMTVVNGYEVRSNWLGYILSTPGVYVFWPLFGGGPRTTPAPKGPTILDLESSRKARQVYQEQFVNGNLGSSQASPNIPDNEILVMSTLAQGDIEFYGVASGLATPLEGAGLPRGTGGSSGGGKAPVSGMPRTSAPSQFVRVDVARSLGAARHSMMDKLDDVLKRHGGTQTSEGFFKFPSRKAARAAASEIAGDLGHAPTAIRKSDFRGGPWSWKNSNGVIGRQMLDPSNPANSLRGWRDDILGHKFDDGTIIGPHVNVWNDFFENLHFTY